MNSIRFLLKLHCEAVFTHFNYMLFVQTYSSNAIQIMYMFYCRINSTFGESSNNVVFSRSIGSYANISTIRFESGVDI
jgi:hypothetical protein